MNDCIFCSIAKGEKPSYKLYEDNNTIAFLDINPVSNGHLLVVPKQHFENIFDVPNDILANLSRTFSAMANLCRDKLGATGVNILNASGKDAQQTVFHLHFHIVPRYENDGLDLWPHGTAPALKPVNDIHKLLI